MSEILTWYKYNNIYRYKEYVTEKELEVDSIIYIPINQKAVECSYISSSPAGIKFSFNEDLLKTEFTIGLDSLKLIDKSKQIVEKNIQKEIKDRISKLNDYIKDLSGALEGTNKVNRNQILTEEKVKEIKIFLKEKGNTTTNRRKLSKIYGVSMHTIYDIGYGRSWKHIKIGE